MIRSDHIVVRPRPAPHRPLNRLSRLLRRLVGLASRRRRPNPRLLDQMSEHLRRDIGLGP